MLRTRSPLSPGQALVLARLACVRRAASVRPEPGSNSPSRSRPALVPRWGVEPAFDRRAAHRSHYDRGATLCPPTRRSYEHGIDMSLRVPDRDRTPVGVTGFWRSLLCFQEADPRRARSGPRSVNVPMSKRHAPDPRPRTTCGFECWCQPAPPFRATFERGDPACGATDKTTGGRCACQTGATTAARSPGGAGVTHDATYTTRRRLRGLGVRPRRRAPTAGARAGSRAPRRAPHLRRGRRHCRSAPRRR